VNALVLAWMAVVVLGAWRWRPPPGRTLAPGNVGSDVTSRPPEPPSVRWPRWVGLAITPALAVDQMARLSPPPFADAFATVVRRVAHGQRLADALDALPERLGDPVRPMVRTLAGAERYGSPLAPALEVLGHEARRDRRRDERGRCGDGR